jgi:hypothetical protein
MWVVVQVNEHDDYDCEESLVITEQVDLVFGPFDTKEAAEAFDNEQTQRHRANGWCGTTYTALELTDPLDPDAISS